MRSGVMRQAMEQAKNIGAYADTRKSQKCFCGRFKWAGFSFCARCMGKLPEDYKASMYGPVSNETALAYDACVAYLVAAGRKAFEGKL